MKCSALHMKQGFNTRQEQFLKIISVWVQTISRVFFVIILIPTVRLLTHILCKPTHFFFDSSKATISYCLQTSFNSVVKD